MRNQKNLNEILKALTEALGCSPLTAETDGRVMFGLDSDMGAVLFPGDEEEYGSDILTASIVIGRPQLSDAGLLLELLEGNYMGAFSGDGTLSIDKASGLLVLFRVFALPADATNFVDAFARLVGAARLWRERLERSESAPFKESADMIKI